MLLWLRVLLNRGHSPCDDLQESEELCLQQLGHMAGDHVDDACSVWEETEGLNTRTLGSTGCYVRGWLSHFVKYLHFPNGSKCYYKE